MLTTLVKLLFILLIIPWSHLYRAMVCQSQSSTREMFELLCVTKIITGTGHDSLLLFLLMHGNVALTDAFFSIINTSLNLFSIPDCCKLVTTVIIPISSKSTCLAKRFRLLPWHLLVLKWQIQLCLSTCILLGILLTTPFNRLRNLTGQLWMLSSFLFTTFLSL